MQKLLTLVFSACMVYGIQAQTIFAEEIELPKGHVSERVVMPPSPLTLQVLFVGGHDIVETTKTYDNPAGRQIAKEWHDFIGMTPDPTGNSVGWVSVNHEMIYRDDKIGDGGGMTVFQIERDPITGLLNVMDQRLDDGRKGKYFNVDFVNTVGETGMNCGGISSTFDGRIWTAEEWFRTSNSSIYNGNVARGARSLPTVPGASNLNQGVRDTAAFTVFTEDFPEWDGIIIDKFENFNFMVEIDPKEAKAIRKQYNWGRMGWEGGAITNDNQNVYLGPDATPGFFMWFHADKPGDFTKGTLYAYKHDSPEYWVEISGTPEEMLDVTGLCEKAGATMYNRPEWVAHDKNTNMIYWAETGRDFPGSRFAGGISRGAVMAPEHNARAVAQGFADATNSGYRDTYGRIWSYNPATREHKVLLEGGPDWTDPISPAESDYFDKHLTNPDGLSVMHIDGQGFLVIQEDMNGLSYGRMPAGADNPTCELFLLNLAIANPTIDDLIRITAVPRGAEVTGAVQTADGASLLVNVQHPSVSNPFPWNHSLTFAIHGFDRVSVDALTDNAQETIINQKKRLKENGSLTNGFTIYPNPATRTVFLEETGDIAIYDVRGSRVHVARNTNRLDVSNLEAGIYFVQNGKGDLVQLVIE
jgi:uncharacterized protein